MTVPVSVVNAALRQAGSYIGGPFGAALGGLVGTTVVTTIEVSELGQKLANGNASFNDIIRATVALEGSLVAAGVLGGTLGVVVAPGALVVALVVVASVYSTYYKNPTAWLDAGEAAFKGVVDGNQPWTIADAVADAYSKEVARQKQIDSAVNGGFTDAQNFVIPRRDPLVLDLDGDGQ